MIETKTLGKKTYRIGQGSGLTIDLDNNGMNTAYFAPVYMGSQGTEMKCIWDTGSDVI